MAKGNYYRKPIPLDVEVELTPAERERKKKLAWFLKKRDEEIKAEQERCKKVCPHCRIVLSPTGKCVNQFCIANR